MTHSGEAAFTLTQDVEDSEAHVDAARLVAEASVAVHHGASRLADYTQRAEVTRDALLADSKSILADVSTAHDAAMKRCHDAQLHVERAAKALAVRALEIDTASLRVAEREAAVAKRERDVTERAAQVAARAASVRYAVIEQAKIHATALELDARAARIAHAEAVLADGNTAAAARQARTEARFRKAENALHERESALEQREADVAAHESSSRDALSRALFQIERDRATFWAHQQRVSADIARITEELFAFHKEVKSEVEAVAVAARSSLVHIDDAISQLSRTIKDAETVHISPCDVSSPEHAYGDVYHESRLCPSLESLSICNNVNEGTTPEQSTSHDGSDS